MKAKAADFLIFDEATQTYRENSEQAVRDDVEKHYWLHVGRTIARDWRLYLMLIPMYRTNSCRTAITPMPFTATCRRHSVT